MRWACGTLDGITLDAPVPDASALRENPQPRRSAFKQPAKILNTIKNEAERVLRGMTIPLEDSARFGENRPDGKRAGFFGFLVDVNADFLDRAVGKVFRLALGLARLVLDRKALHPRGMVP